MTGNLIFAISPSNVPFDRDLAGSGNGFATYDEAAAAARSMNESNQLADGAKWEIFECCYGRAGTAGHRSAWFRI